MTAKQKKLLIKIIVSSAVFVIALLLPFDKYKIIPFLISYFILGYSVILKALKNISHGQIFDENFLMLIATLGAFALKEYPEAVAVMLFYQVGELFESVAVGRSRKSISDLVNIVPEFANKMIDGQITQVMPEEVEIGDIIIVKTGEKIPLDGIVVSNGATVETSALTGESLPRELAKGDEALSGCINLGETMEIKVTKEFEDSTASKIMYLVEEAASQKAATESFITKFARRYTPAVVIAAVIIAIVPSIITGEWAEWISRALLFLVVSCPCALVVSVPLTFFCSIGKASKSGVLIKGSNFIEMLAKADVAVFDKTGTLTCGKFAVVDVNPYNIDKDEFIRYLAFAESYIDHPIAQSVKALYKGQIDYDEISNSKQLPGFGVSGVIDGKTVLAGNEALMKKEGIEYEKAETDLTVIYGAVDGKFIGWLTVADQVKTESKNAISNLKESGIKQTVMLTGDQEKIGNYVANKTGIDKVYSGLLPEDKAQKLKEIKSENGTVIYTGDGLNDAPVLVEADVGIAMGAMGSDAAIEAADVVIMDDNVSKIPLAVKISKKTMKIVRENIVFALGIKFAIMILGVFGLANMWMAVFADVGVSILAILNALRVQK